MAEKSAALSEKGLITIAKGKYQQWLTPDGLTRIEGWAREGLTDAQIAVKMGISEASLYNYQAKFVEILEALKRGKAPVDNDVENALLKRALGYEYEEVTTEVFDMPDGSQRKHIKKTRKMVVPDTTAQIFWLKNRRPDIWRDKPEGYNADNEPVKVIIDV